MTEPPIGTGPPAASAQALPTAAVRSPPPPSSWEQRQISAAATLESRTGTTEQYDHMKKGIGERVASLFSFGCIRVTRILETIHCAILYSILAYFFGYGIDKLLASIYPVSDPEGELTHKGQVALTLLVCTLQVVTSAVAVIYIRKIAAVVPFIFNLCPDKYLEGYHVSEIEGEIALALVFVGSQVNLIHQLEKVSNYLGGRATPKKKQTKGE